MQIIALLVGGLLIAQFVILLLTILLPPAPPPTYELSDIARVLRSGEPGIAQPRALVLRIQPGPPVPQGGGWLQSDRSRVNLARLMRRSPNDVRLYFYTPLPFEGAILMPEPPKPRVASMLMFDEGPGGSGGGGPAMPGGAPGGLAAAAMPGTGTTGLRDGGAISFPGGSPAARRQGAGRIGDGTTMSPGGGRFSQSGVILPPSRYAQPGDTAPAFSQSLAPRGIARSPAPMPVIEGGRPGEGHFPAPRIARLPAPLPRFDDAPLQRFPGDTFRLPVAAAPKPEPIPVPANDPDDADTPTAIASPPPIATEPAKPVAPITQLPTPAQTPTIDRDGVPIARVPQVGLFGLGTQPYIQGDFVAALRLGPARWAIVQPAAEPFPNAWQRRVFLWFLVSLAVVVPLGLFFARRLARPLASFADAAEQLGLDPSSPVITLEGPAEIGRAADAFNRMQGRLKSFVADRTAMMGAISHDLRNPLTRLRFRIEEVDDALRDGMIGEVAEMETMIGSVLDFLRDAADPGERQRIDLRSLVETAVDDAAFVGKDVELGEAIRAPVAVDALAIKRTLANLIDNAVKYGRQARISLTIDGDDAIVDIRDRGPGLSDDDMERIFQPFYRTDASRASGKAGIGLGLSVCRSIARAHGGDVSILRCADGLIARLRLPLITGATTKTAPHIAKLQA
ncbi:ATP-binding protein [Sphingomonas sp. YR710]|uniref:ATP-binding protein n=1 Tax=Sphingomonas sp. YR710 TaxID=1882773 RepID=UPI0015A2D391|nr:ATP-binding protein [Sphingomonas sp. YR710]